MKIGPDVGGVVIDFADGRQSMAFVHDCAAWTSTCMVRGSALLCREQLWGASSRACDSAKVGLSLLP